MIPATVQQLDVVSRKASRLEQTVATHIETLKAARKERTEAEELVRDLRARLMEAEERHETAILVHEKAETTLRLAATEYSRAQLLQKRLTNTLKDLQGFNRSVVVTEGGDVYKTYLDEKEGGRGAETDDDENKRVALGPQFLRVADPCTIHAPTMRKTIVVDAIAHSSGGRQGTLSDNDNNSNGVGPLSSQMSTSSSSSTSTLSSLLIPSMVSDALGGYNVCYTAVGPKRAGKTTAMWGALRETNKISSSVGGGAFNISPQNAKLRGAISDPSGFLLAKYFLGFEHFRGFTDASSSGATTLSKGGSDSANSNSCPVAVAPLFMHHLFSQFSAYDVTHFNIRVSFVEMVEDGLLDLLMVIPQLQHGSAAAAAHHNNNNNLLSGGDATPMPIGFFGNFDEESGGEDVDGNAINKSSSPSAPQDARRIGWSRLHTATSIQVRSEEEFYLTLQKAFMNRDHKLMGRQRAMAKAGVPLGGGFATASKRATSALGARGGVGGVPAYEQQLLTPHEIADLLGGHLVLTVSIENFNSRGNFRRSTTVFCDVAGGLTPTSTTPAVATRAPSSVTTNEQLWASRGAWALTDVISMSSATVATAMAESHRRSASTSSFHNNNNHSTREMVNTSANNNNNMSTFFSSAAAGQLSPFAVTAAAEAAHRALASTALPHTSNRLVNLLQEVFGGNAKGVLLCVLPRASALADDNGESTDTRGIKVGDASRVGGGAAAQSNPNHNLAAAVNALAYAHHFKGTCHNAVPFDIPPELQQLTREAEVHNTSSVSAAGADADVYGDEPRLKEEEEYYGGSGGGQHIHR